MLAKSCSKASTFQSRKFHTFGQILKAAAGTSKLEDFKKNSRYKALLFTCS